MLIGSGCGADNAAAFAGDWVGMLASPATSCTDGSTVAASSDFADELLRDDGGAVRWATAHCGDLLLHVDVSGPAPMAALGGGVVAVCDVGAGLNRQISDVLLVLDGDSLAVHYTNNYSSGGAFCTVPTSGTLKHP
jgi:hypothetical protein